MALLALAAACVLGFLGGNPLLVVGPIAVIVYVDLTDQKFGLKRQTEIDASITVRDLQVPIVILSGAVAVAVSYCAGWLAGWSIMLTL